MRRVVGSVQSEVEGFEVKKEPDGKRKEREITDATVVGRKAFNSETTEFTSSCDTDQSLSVCHHCHYSRNRIL